MELLIFHKIFFLFFFYFKNLAFQRDYFLPFHYYLIPNLKVDTNFKRVRKSLTRKEKLHSQLEIWKIFRQTTINAIFCCRIPLSRMEKRSGSSEKAKNYKARLRVHTSRDALTRFLFVRVRQSSRNPCTLRFCTVYRPSHISRGTTATFASIFPRAFAFADDCLSG